MKEENKKQINNKVFSLCTEEGVREFVREEVIRCLELL
jgi:hypothetical protein